MSKSRFRFKFRWERVFVPLSLVLFSAFFDSPSSLNQKGNQLFEEKRYQSALETYRKAQVKKPAQPEILYNLGTTLYQVNQFQEAEEKLQKAIAQNPSDKSFLARNWYNYGNALYRLGQFDKAIDAYKKTLDLDPKDKDAKHNLEILLKKKGLFEKKESERSKQSPKKSEKKNESQSAEGQGGGSGQEGKKDQPTNQEQGEENKKPAPSEGNKEAPAGGAEKGQEKSPKPSNAETKKDESKEKDQKDRNKPNELQGEIPTKPAEDQTAKAAGAKENTPLLQGQMSKEDAYRILEALRDSEKELQVLRKPKASQNPERPDRDW